MSDLRNMWTEGMRELENTHMHCTNNDDHNNELDGVEVINLCSVSQSKSDASVAGKESTKQESQDKSKHDAVDKMEAELRTMRSKSLNKIERVKSVMMCWESMSNFTEEEPHKEQIKEVVKKSVKKMEKPKHEEDHVEPTINTGNRLKNLIKELSWEREDNRSTLETEELEQDQVVYIANLKNGLQKDSTKLYEEEGPNEKACYGK